MRRFRQGGHKEAAVRALLCDLPLFIEAARTGSFTRASERLDMNIATLSRRIAELEKKLGIVLFSRTTRRMELTTSGRLLLERGEYIVSEISSSLDAVTRHMTSPSGPVNISIHEEEVYHTFLRGVFARLSEQWPDINLLVSFFEHLDENPNTLFDIIIRSGPLPDSPLVARKIFTISPGIYAAPLLLKAYPPPTKPEELLAMPCIRLNRSGNSWGLSNGTRTITLHFQPAFQFSSISLCNEFALAGRGVAMLRRGFAEPRVREGSLVRLLPEWTGPEHAYYLVRMPGQIPQRVRLVIDYIIAHFERINKDSF